MKTHALSLLGAKNLRFAMLRFQDFQREWAETSAAIAEKVATFGANSIEVAVSNSQIIQKQGSRFRELVHTYYAPDINHSVWDEKQSWRIYVAFHLATQRDVNIDQEFSELNEKLLDKGVDPDKADKKAGAVIAKKYNLPENWTLPVGNISFNGEGLDRNSFSIDTSQSTGSLNLLQECMEGKIIRMESSC